MSKFKVSVEFQCLDGRSGQRSRMLDFQTLRGRIFERLRATAVDCENTVMAGVNAYNAADYEGALAHFSEAVCLKPKLADELAPHIRSCRRALGATPTEADICYRDALAAWLRLPRFLRWIRRHPAVMLRCKYCGHYTPYIYPNSGMAYLGTNNCTICERGYPAPDFVWDGLDGLAYIYYRHSVTESAFYTEFESQYEVHPDHTFFMRDKSTKP